MQDEIDRANLALMGYKENNEQPKVLSKTMTMTKPISTDTGNPYVTLDKQCLTCSGQSSVVLKAFKIACLTYKPTPLTYRSKVFSRPDLIDLRGKMLKSFWKSSVNRAPWKQTSDHEIDRAKRLFNQFYLYTTEMQKDGPKSSIFDSKHPKITIRSETMSNIEISTPVSPQEMRSKNISMLNDKTHALSRNPLVDALPKRKGKKDSLKELIGAQTMALPEIKRGNQTAR